MRVREPANEPHGLRALRLFSGVVATVVVGGAEVAQGQGEIVGWGQQVVVEQEEISQLLAVSAGGSHSVVLKSDGTIVAWGANYSGQCDVASPNADFVAVAASWSHSLGLKSDGSVVAWGGNSEGQCSVPYPNTGFVAIAGGGYHSLGLKSNGSVVAWGRYESGQTNVPSPNTGFVAVAAGFGHSLGLKSDGSVIAWGNNSNGQCNVPASNTGFIAVAAGNSHSLGLKSDGSVVAWGYNHYGQCDVPFPNTGFVGVAGGLGHSLGVKSDGSVVAWGRNVEGQCNVHSPNSGLVVVAAGAYHSLGIRDRITAVSLSDVVAAGGHGYVDLRCSVMLDHPGGLLVLRALEWDGTYDAVKSEIALAAGRTEFSYRDSGVEPATEYFYKIACRETDVWVYSAPVRVVTPGGVFALLETGMNPSRGSARRLLFELDHPGECRLDVFDVAGRRVCNVASGQFLAGVNSVDWDGRAEDGEKVAQGVYWVRLQSASRATSAKIVVLR